MGTGGGAITDHYAYNEALDRMKPGPEFRHWVGDIGLECWIDIASDSGVVALEVTEGGAHFQLHVDVASGKGTLRTDHDAVQWLGGDGQPIDSREIACQTQLQGSGSYRVELLNADNRIFAWINGTPIEFNGQPFVDYRRSDPVRLSYSEADPGDVEPVGIGAQSVQMTVSRIKVWRDVYYVSISALYKNEYRIVDAREQPMVDRILDDPATWGSEPAQRLFARQERAETDVRKFGPAQFFPMGDNSPSSLDARYWSEPAYVERSQLLGRALFVFFPHTWNRPVPFFPDFTRMKFIR
jgi:signal peptidase I